MLFVFHCVFVRFLGINYDFVFAQRLLSPTLARLTDYILTCDSILARHSIDRRPIKYKSNKWKIEWFYAYWILFANYPMQWNWVFFISPSAIEKLLFKYKMSTNKKKSQPVKIKLDWIESYKKRKHSHTRCDWIDKNHMNLANRAAKMSKASTHDESFFLKLLLYLMPRISLGSVFIDYSMGVCWRLSLFNLNFYAAVIPRSRIEIDPTS